MSGLKFERSIRKFAKKAPEDFFRALKSAGFVAYRDLISQTPVDTGNAKRGWKIKIQKRGEFSIIIYNNVHYIKYLALGISEQAKSGWVDDIVAVIPANVKRLAK